MSETLSKTIWIDAPLAVVHGYFVEADKMALWSGTAARLDPRPGGVYELDMGAAGVLSGRFVRIEADRIEQEIDAPDGGVPGRIDIRLTEEAGGTRVSIRQTGLASPFDAIASRGWDHHLARLSVVSNGGNAGPDSLCDKPMDALLGR